MIAFIDDHREAYGVEPICRVLPIAPSTYHAHAARRADPSRLPDRLRRGADLKVEIQRVFVENFGVYGVRKVWRQLRREGFKTARCTVARLMRDMGLRGAVRGKPLRTTISDKAAPSPLDHVNRQFQALAPDRLWLADFTYVATWAGFGGAQYVSIKYTEQLAEAGIEPSVGSVGDSYDNALAETINGLYKTEVIHRRGPWRNFEAVEFATLEWVDWFNNRRLLEPIGFIPPAEAEERYFAMLKDTAMAA